MPSHGQGRSSLSSSPPDRPVDESQIEETLVSDVKHLKEADCVTLNEELVVKSAELSTLS